MDAATRYIDAMDLIELYVKARIATHDADLQEHIRLMRPEFDAYRAMNDAIVSLCSDAAGLPRHKLTAEQRRVVARSETDEALDGAVAKMLPEVMR